MHHAGGDATFFLWLTGGDHAQLLQQGLVLTPGDYFGAAGAGVIANGAGLTDALLPADVSHAVLAVLGIGVLAPLGALVMALRFTGLVAASPEPAGQAPSNRDRAKSAPDSAGATH